jgi:hypothetical protein
VDVLWAGDTTRSYQIQVSGNNSSWTTVASGTTSNTSPQAISTSSFTTTPTGRYVRLVAVDRWNSSYGNSVWEMGVYGSTTSSGIVGDVNGNGKVDVFDLSAMLTGWNSATANLDLNHDGVVNVFDLSLMLSHWTG